MNIAQVAPLSESVPPKQYGGSERIVSYLTEELIRLGHEVTLFASADSKTGARLHPICPHGIRLNKDPFRRDIFLTLLLERAFGSSEFDMIHSHVDFLGFPFTRRNRTPILTTVHGKLDLPELQLVYGEYSEAPLISISYSQRRACPEANWKTTVYHGIPERLYSIHAQPGAYLAFLGRISPEKGPEAAIQVAKRAGLPLRIAAKVDPVDREYFRTVIEPLIAPPFIEYLGEISDHEKDEFLGNACALLCPFRPEPFGLVLIEALACGTPIVSYAHGSFPEIIDDGVTGYLCRSVDDMVEAVKRVPQLDRRRCRRTFEERFTAERMAQDYLMAYKELLIEKGRANALSARKKRQPLPER
ncbi:MAG TPA: glycosyltransferase family 4 protein [Nitrospiraceae bacterium]|nr:glycosyltransferase family 4 protein [Nitrospiraceae bacterium]